MKTVLIADDEKTIRDGLEQLVSSKREFEVIGKCKNGQEALDLGIKKNPDIIITDIKMPVMDGLTMIQKYIAKKKPKFIILSGYDEFEYARTAYKMNVFDYVLKPVDVSAFLKLLDKVCEAIDEETNQKNMEREHFALLLLQDTVFSPEVIASSSRNLSVQLNSITPVVYLSRGAKSLSDESRLKRSEFLKNYLYENSPCDCLPVSINGYLVVLYLGVDLDEKSMANFLQRTITVFNNHFASNYLCCGIGKCVTHISEVRDSYIGALNALSYGIYSKEKRLLTYSPEQKLQPNLEVYFYKDKNLLFDTIRNLQRDKTLAIIHEFIDRSKQELYPPSVLIQFLRDLYGFCYNSVYPSEVLKEFDVEHVIEDINCMTYTIDEISEIFTDLSNRTLEYIEHSSDNHTGSVVDNVIKYINLNYRNDITLDDISNKFFINKSYFCKIFKEKTDSTFNNFLTSIRMKKAKSLILEDTYKVYEIADRVGFKDPKYFAKTFKEFTGLTPSEFKQKNS
ncbi:MAG: response regulator [Clostridiales bacterium]|nr:response regulator [Clostridiales bacterium]